MAGDDTKTVLQLSIDKGALQQTGDALTATIKESAKEGGVELSKSIKAAIEEGLKHLKTLEADIGKTGAKLSRVEPLVTQQRAASDPRGYAEAKVERRESRAQMDRLVGAVAGIHQANNSMQANLITASAAQKHMNAVMQQAYTSNGPAQPGSPGGGGGGGKFPWGKAGHLGINSMMFPITFQPGAGMQQMGAGLGGLAGSAFGPGGAEVGNMIGGTLGALGDITVGGAYRRDRSLARFGARSGMGRKQALELNRRAAGMGFSPEEFGQFGTSLATGTGSGNAINEVLKLERGTGQGAQGVNMLSSLARRTGQSIAPDAATRKFGMVLGAGMAQGLERGRWGEMFEGIAHLADRATLGTKFDDESAARVAAALGKTWEGFRGAQGFQVMQGLDSSMKGQTGGVLGRGMSLMTAGLGEPGVSYIESLKRQEGGLFGASRGNQATPGAARLQKWLGMAKQMAGGENETMDLIMGNATGLPLSTVEKLRGLGSKASEQDIKKIIDQGKGAGERAFEKIDADWTKMMSALETMKDALADHGDKFMPTLTKALLHAIHIVDKAAPYTDFLASPVDYTQNALKSAAGMSKKEWATMLADMLKDAAPIIAGVVPGGVLTIQISEALAGKLKVTAKQTEKKDAGKAAPAGPAPAK